MTNTTYHPSQVASTLAQLAGQSPYQVLNVNESATPCEIKLRFRKLAMELHPDHTASKPNVLDLNNQFNRIKVAYEVLSDQQLRSAYDTYSLHNKRQTHYHHAIHHMTSSSYTSGKYNNPTKSSTQPGTSPYFSHFHPDNPYSYGRFSYAGYHPYPNSPSTLRMRNGYVAVGVMGFTIIGMVLQYYWCQYRLRQLRTRVNSTNAYNMNVLRNVRERAKSTSVEQFHHHLADHISLID